MHLKIRTKRGYKGMINKGTSIKVSGYKLPHPSLSALIALRTMFALRTFQLRRGRALPVTLFFFLLAGCATAPTSQTALNNPHYSYRMGFTSGRPQCSFFDDFHDNGDGTVTDPRNGLVWKRCAEGYEWRNGSCLGTAKNIGWKDAMRAARNSRYHGNNDWRLPTRKELESIVSANKTACFDNDFGKGQYAASNTLAHPVDKYGFPGGFWSSEAQTDKFGSNAFFVSFGNAYVGQADGLIQPYRLVRPGK